MTRSDAIDMLRQICSYLTAGNPVWRTEPIREACEMAIEALTEKDPSAEPTQTNDANVLNALDCVERQAAIDALCDNCNYPQAKCAHYPCDQFVSIEQLPSAGPRWIPFKTRPLTEDEKEDHPEWECILDCKLPDNGQRILVSINLRGHEEVQQDEYYSDDGSYLDSNYEIGTEATAWMPLPEPWEGEKHE